MSSSAPFLINILLVSLPKLSSRISFSSVFPIPWLQTKFYYCMGTFPSQSILFRATKLTFMMKNLEYVTSLIKYMKYSPFLHTHKKNSLTFLTKWVFKDFIWELPSVWGALFHTIPFHLSRFPTKRNNSSLVNTALIFSQIFRSRSRAGWGIRQYNTRGNVLRRKVTKI